MPIPKGAVIKPVIIRKVEPRLSGVFPVEAAVIVAMFAQLDLRINHSILEFF